MALRWRESFSLNVKDIDDQHKKLFEISSKLNILAPVCSKINFEEEILKVINELKEYALYHFDYEEKLMQKTNFKGFDEHRLEHEDFVISVLKFEQENPNFNKPETVMNLLDFVTGWITAHILKTDMKYKDFFNGKGIY
jgi:hemerythrin